MELDMSGGVGGWRAESIQGQVHGPRGSERARPPVPKPHTPLTTRAKQWEPVPSLPDAGGRAGHQMAPLQLCQSPPPPWDQACQAAQLSLSSPAPQSILPKATSTSPRALSPSLRWGSGDLTTVLLRWLWTVKSGQKSKSAMARSRDSARGRAFSSSSSPCSGHSTQGPPQ